MLSHPRVCIHLAISISLTPSPTSSKSRNLSDPKFGNVPIQIPVWEMIESMANSKYLNSKVIRMERGNFINSLEIHIIPKTTNNIYTLKTTYFPSPNLPNKFSNIYIYNFQIRHSHSWDKRWEVISLIKIVLYEIGRLMR